MAQAQTTSTPARKTGTLHLNKGQAVPAKKTRKPRTHRVQVEKPVEPEITRPIAPPRANESVWVHALAGAEGFHRDALGIELAVGLSVFSVKADAAKVPLAAKTALREIYAAADYACATPQGDDYKTVNRRINVTADLYQHLGGRETIVDWIGDAAPREQVKMILEHIKTYKFDSMSAVLAYMGKGATVKRPRIPHTTEGPTDAERDVADAALAAITLRAATGKLGLPADRVFSHGAMTVAVPPDATYDDVMSIISDLSVFAATKLRALTPPPAPEAAPVAPPASAPAPALATV